MDISNTDHAKILELQNVQEFAANNFGLMICNKSMVGVTPRKLSFAFWRLLVNRIIMFSPFAR